MNVFVDGGVITALLIAFVLTAMAWIRQKRHALTAPSGLPRPSSEPE